MGYIPFHKSAIYKVCEKTFHLWCNAVRGGEVQGIITSKGTTISKLYYQSKNGKILSILV